jgi:hypothetical protein
MAAMRHIDVTRRRTRLLLLLRCFFASTKQVLASRRARCFSTAVFASSLEANVCGITKTEPSGAGVCHQYQCDLVWISTTGDILK